MTLDLIYQQQKEIAEHQANNKYIGNVLGTVIQSKIILAVISLIVYTFSIKAIPILSDNILLAYLYIGTVVLSIWLPIEVVCLDGWHDILRVYAKQFNITKLKWVVSGGDTGQESIRNGVFNLKELCHDEDIIIIHYGIRPLVDESVLSDVIVMCKKYGNAASSLPYNEQIFKINDEISTCEYIPRETLRRVTTPQAYKYGKLSLAY